MKKSKIVLVVVMVLALCLVCAACRKKDPIGEPAQNASEAVDSNKGSEVSSEVKDESFYNNTGVITISWSALSGDEAPALCTSLYDFNGCDLFITADDLDDDGSRRIVYQVPGYFCPESLVITGNDLETINSVMSEIDFTIEMSRTDENGEEEYYAVSKDSLDDCYVRWDTGVWGYSIPVEWDGFYLSELQAD